MENQLAAPCLHEQEYGFTREMVEAADFILDTADFGDCGPRGEGWQSAEMAKAVALLKTMAQNVEALLLPEDT